MVTIHRAALDESMQVIDTTGDFVRDVIISGNPGAYHERYPALFDHYYAFWANRDAYDAKLTEQYIRQKAGLILEQLPLIESKFRSAGFPLDSIKLVLLVGQGTSNGHAFREGNRFTVWIPVETYPGELSVRVFVSHEIAHALHYEREPAFYFGDTAGKNRVSRQVITEGIAAYIPMIFLGTGEKETLWADYLNPGDVELWFQECLRQEKQLKEHVLEKWNDEDEDLFTLVDTNDVFRSRGGYYVGLRMIEKIVNRTGMDVESLLATKRKELDDLARDVLGGRVNHI
jgi:hypothetical protein